MFLVVGQTIKHGMWTALKARYDRLVDRLSAGVKLVLASSHPESRLPSTSSHSIILPSASVVAIVALLLVSFLLPYLNTGYAANDDMQNVSLPYSRFVQMASDQGRLFFLTLHGLTASGAHICREMVVTKTVSLLVIVTNFILFGWLVHRLTGNTAITWLALLAWTTLQRDSWEHYLITASPLLYTLPLSLFFLSLITCDRGIECGSKKLLFLSAFLYALTLQYSEMFYTLVLCFFPILYRHPTASWKSLSFHGIFFLLMVLLYGAWRLCHPSQYEGNSFDGCFRLKDFFRTLLTYSLSNFPAYHYDTPDEIRRFSIFQGSSFNPFHGLPVLITWLQNLRCFEPAWLLRAALAAGIVWILLRRFAATLSFSAWMVIGTFTACLVFLPNVPHALTPKYQRWVREDSHIYAGTYFSFFGICLLMGAFASHLMAITRIGLIRTATAVVFTTLVFIGTLKISAWNEAEVASKVYAHRKWEYFDDFLSSTLFRELPAGSIIYAPSLMTRTYHIPACYPGYWNEYIRYKTGRDVSILTEREEIAASLQDKTPASAPRYYLKYSPNHNWSETCLLFAPIQDLQLVKDFVDPIRVISNEAEVFFRSFDFGNYNYRILFFQDESGNRAVEVPNPRPPRSIRKFKFHLQGKGIRLHSVFAVNNRDALYFYESPRVDYGSGFYQSEQKDTGRFAWAYGHDSELRLVNLADHAVEAELSFQLSDWGGNKSIVTVQAQNTRLRFSPPPRGSLLPVVLPLQIPPEGMVINFHYELDAAHRGSRKNLPSITFGLFNPVVRKRLNPVSR